MDVLLKSLTQHASVVLLALVLLWIFGTLIQIRTAVRQRRFEVKWRELLSDTRGESLETMLYDHLRQRLHIEERIEKVNSRLDTLEVQIRSAVRHVGLVRYDAFPDVAGGQSFSLAVYDDNGDGAIMSSIVGRNSCRVYCKPLVSGRSERDLSQEEQRAVKAAAESGVRPILSP
jgi:hypothetical protein